MLHYSRRCEILRHSRGGKYCNSTATQQNIARDETIRHKSHNAAAAATDAGGAAGPKSGSGFKSSNLLLSSADT